MGLQGAILKKRSVLRKLLAEANLTDCVMAFSTTCLLIVALIAAGISYFQWREMRSGGVDTHELALAGKAQADATKAEADSMKDLAEREMRQAEATDALARQAEKSATASIKSAQDADISARATKDMAAISAESLKYAKENAQLDERAWLAITSLRLARFQQDKKLEAQIGYSNSGRSPALRVTIVGAVFVLDLGTNPVFLDLAPLGDFTALRAIAPQTGNTWTHKGEKPITAEEREQVGNGTKVIWVWGFIRYDDTFGLSHVTQFCGNTSVNGMDSLPIQEGMELNLCPGQNGMN